MKFNIHVNQPQAIDLGIKNINQAHIFDLLSTCAVWADNEIIEKKVYYWVSRTVICNELPLLDMKPDTVYRHLKVLVSLGLIDYVKLGKKDCIRITKLGKNYQSNTISEINPSTMSETNPKKLGNKSENNSEINPTYHTTILYPHTKESHKGIIPRDIVNLYYKNISTKQEKIKEQKSFTAMGLIPSSHNLEMIYIGLENYSKVLPADEKYIKSLLNFIQNREYLDFQEAKQIQVPKTNNPTADMVRKSFSNHNQTSNDDIEETEVL